MVSIILRIANNGYIQLNRAGYSLEKNNSALKFEISGNSRLCQIVRENKILDFLKLALFVETLPYGRTVSSLDPAVVLFEKKGTCSTKHRLLAAVAHDCGYRDIHLVVGIYAMNEINTPGVGEVLTRAHLEYVPEAHCYLKHNDLRYDFTGLGSGAISPFASLYEEHIVDPHQLIKKKIALHREFVDRWANERKLSPELVWRIRENCIAALSLK